MEGEEDGMREMEFRERQGRSQVNLGTRDDRREMQFCEAEEK
jgi:hypothetical protein